MGTMPEEHLWKVECEGCGVIGWFTTKLEALHAQRQHAEASEDHHAVALSYHGEEPSRA